MIELMTGILIVILGSGPVAFRGYSPESYNLIKPPIDGGHLNASLTMMLTANVKVAEFIAIEGLADCMSPENIQVRDLEGRDVPFLIRDEQSHDKARRWAIVPKNEFRHFDVIIDIDFVNKCEIV